MADLGAQRPINRTRLVPPRCIWKRSMLGGLHPRRMFRTERIRLNCLIAQLLPGGGFIACRWLVKNCSTSVVYYRPHVSVGGNVRMLALNLKLNFPQHREPRSQLRKSSRNIGFVMATTWFDCFATHRTAARDDEMLISSVTF